MHQLQKNLYCPCLLLLFLCSACGTSVSTDINALKKKIEVVHLEWDSYQEDIKAQVGAKEAALWSGEPVSIQVNQNQLEITFKVNAPWDSYGVAMPILYRSPAAKIYASTKVKVEGSTHAYIFELEDMNDNIGLSWVELHYPHTERRFTLIEGQWSAEK